MISLQIKTLRKGWHDKDEILLHAAFQLLADFIEKEKPAKIVDWNANSLHKKVWREIQALYKWWKVTRPSRKGPLDDRKLKHPPMRVNKLSGSDMYEMVESGKKKYAPYYRALTQQIKLEQNWEEEDQRNLRRLIEIRSFLWT